MGTTPNADTGNFADYCTMGVDANALYIGVIAHDTEGTGRLVRYQKRRDELLQSDDKVQWTIDTFLDGRSGYRFELNAAGVKRDAELAGDTDVDWSWDAAWDGAAVQTSDGWTAVTRDRSLSAQFEHSLAVTENGAEIFTLSPKGWHAPPYV